MTDTLQKLLLERGADAAPALLFGDQRWSWREYVEESSCRATALARLRDPARPFHVGLLMNNTPEMAMGLAAAALGGFVVAGLNTTRRGEGLARDARHADCQIVLTDADHLGLLRGLDLAGARVVDVDSPEWKELLAPAALSQTFPEVEPSDLFMLIFTSGTSGEPKAVRVTHEKVAVPGAMLTQMFGLTAEDVFYLSMPMFHSNAIMAGWGPGVACGAAMSLAPKFSASGFIDDVRRCGATYMNYVGKPLAYVLATPPRPDDDDNALRIAFGNEANDKDIAAFADRFGCWVQDGFGSTEGAVVVSRVPGTPPGSLGQPQDGVKVLDPGTGEECPPARFGPDGEVANLDEAVGELVNTTGAGLFAGYYKDEAANASRMRGGMYWSGDLAYRDEDGWVYFAGRTSDWLRVDGENLAAAPIERLLLRHPDVSRVAVYAVADEKVGDQVMAALVLCDGAEFDATGFEDFLGQQSDLGTKMRPRYVRVASDLPSTATNKILKRELVRQGLDAGDPVWERDPRGTAYRRR